MSIYVCSKYTSLRIKKIGSVPGAELRIKLVQLKS